MGSDNWRADLRGAVARGDGLRVIEMLGNGPMPEDALQLIGDGLLSAMVHQVETARLLATRCAAALRERGWHGDDNLADQLAAAPGRGPESMLKPLSVDLEELAAILEGDPLSGSGRIDLVNGEVWHRAAIDCAQEMGEESEDESDDADRWLWVDCEGSHEGYRDMELFIGTVDDAERARQLDIATDGRGAFRRFKGCLSQWPGELERWHAFSDERQRGRARAWLATAGYKVVR